jgi:hypothetical protein
MNRAGLRMALVPVVLPGAALQQSMCLMRLSGGSLLPAGAAPRQRVLPPAEEAQAQIAE